MANHNKMRHRAEISPNCRISLETISNHPYSFSVLPSPTDRLYILDGLTQEDRVRFHAFLWMLGHVDSVHSGVQIPRPADQQPSHASRCWQCLRPFFLRSRSGKGSIRNRSARWMQCTHECSLLSRQISRNTRLKSSIRRRWIGWFWSTSWWFCERSK